ncbi:MAG TPA: cyclic nucleotide-binding domain-containing protein [Gallionella sp.]
MTTELDIKILSTLEPISTFDQVRLRELAGYCQITSVNAGGDTGKLFGQSGKSVYLIDGEIELAYQDGNKVTIKAESEWAKHPLGKRQPDIVSARALRASRLLSVDEDLLDRMMTWEQVAQHNLDAVAKPGARMEPRADNSVDAQRLMRSSMFSVDRLNSGPLAHLPMANVGELLRRIESVNVRANEVIVREGGEGDYYYIIDSGRVQVTRHVGGVELPLAELREGDVFGEEALISGAKRNATVTMKTDGILLRLGREDFMTLLKEPLLHKSSYEHAIHAVSNGAVWLDVRYPPEFRHDRLPGAMNVPLNEIRDAIGVLDRGKKYIACCQSGQRSAAAAFILAQAGYDVEVLDGGLWSVPRTAQK